MAISVVQDVQVTLPFGVRRLGSVFVQFLFSSFDGDIIVTETRRNIRSWMDMKIGECRYFEGYPLWKVQKQDKNTLILCFCSRKNTIFPRDLSCASLHEAMKNLGGHV